MEKYICKQCTGRSCEEQIFRMSKEPRFCPYNGCDSHNIKTIEEYLREEVERLKSQTE